MKKLLRCIGVMLAVLVGLIVAFTIYYKLVFLPRQFRIARNTVSEAYAWLEKGNSFLAAGSTSDAIAAYEKAQELLPDWGLPRETILVAQARSRGGGVYVRPEDIKDIRKIDMNRPMSNPVIQVYSNGQWIAVDAAKRRELTRGDPAGSQ